MSQQELLTRVIQVLEEFGIDYMVTGSVASSTQGEPRASHDIDLVVELKLGKIGALQRAFPSPDYYLSREAILDAIRHGSMFNLLSLADGDKVDFWMLTDEPFDQSRFRRRIHENVFGIPVSMSAPEDTILAKLRWAVKSGGSEKQFTDALRVYEVQRPNLDIEYLEEWAAKLSVESLWTRLKESGTAD